MDLVLVGDSLGMAALGYKDTKAVTLDEMIHHTKAVPRAVKTAFVLGDLPLGSYKTATEHGKLPHLRTEFYRAKKMPQLSTLPFDSSRKGALMGLS